MEKLKQEEEKKIATLQRAGSGKKSKAPAADLVDASNQMVPGDDDDELGNEDQYDEEDDEDDDEETDDTDEDDDDDDEDDDEDAEQDAHSRGSR